MDYPISRSKDVQKTSEQDYLRDYNLHPKRSSVISSEAQLHFGDGRTLLNNLDQHDVWTEVAGPT